MFLHFSLLPLFVMADLLLLGPSFCATEVVRRLIQRHERQRQQHKVWLVTFACAELPSLKCHLFALQAPGKQQARRSTGPAGSVWEVSMFILRSWIIGLDAGPSSGTGMRWHWRAARWSVTVMEGIMEGHGWECCHCRCHCLPLL